MTSFNNTVESPDFDLIRKETGRATEDALRSQWYILNDEMRNRRQNDKRLQDHIDGKILLSTVAVSQNNFDTENSLVVLFTDAGAFNVTGVRNGTEGRLVIFFNLGAGTKTLKNASGSSDALNQIRTNSGGDLALTQDKGAILFFGNSLWRELKLA